MSSSNMVRNYLIVVGIVWLILHGLFSWGMPDAWLGIAVLKDGRANGTRNLGSCELAGQGSVRGIHDKD